jgi:hypothetical protein
MAPIVGAGIYGRAPLLGHAAFIEFSPSFAAQAAALRHFPTGPVIPSYAQVVRAFLSPAFPDARSDAGPTSNPLTPRAEATDRHALPAHARRPHPRGINPMKLVRFGAPGAEKPVSSTRKAAFAISPPTSRTSPAIRSRPRASTSCARSIPSRCRAPPRACASAPSGRAQLSRHRSQLCRPRQGGGHADPARAHHLRQDAQLHRRRQRRRDDPKVRASSTTR